MCGGRGLRNKRAGVVVILPRRRATVLIRFEIPKQYIVPVPTQVLTKFTVVETTVTLVAGPRACECGTNAVRSVMSESLPGSTLRLLLWSGSER